jgi:hypothetical protein
VKGLLRLILLKAVWMAIVVPSVFVVSGLIAFALARGISRLAGKDLDELGACFIVPIAVSLFLSAIFGLGWALRKFDERRAARNGVAVQTPGERGAGEMSQSYGREHQK